ncbi:MAG: thioesterase [Acidobacteria bacterium]|nr:MAG: thioesterase [Acidobacteriota bacterium]
MKPPSIPLDRIAALAPACLRLTVPKSYGDANGHMNVRWFVALFDDAGDAVYERLRLTPEYRRQHGITTFDLEHHTHFLSEVVPGDSAAVYVRFVGHSAKRFHYVMFMVNETRGALAATFECVTTFVDLRSRRSAAMPPDILTGIADWVARDSRRDWAAPLSGAMRS